MELFAFIGLFILFALFLFVSYWLFIIIGNIIVEGPLKSLVDKISSQKRKDDEDYWVY